MRIHANLDLAYRKEFQVRYLYSHCQSGGLDEDRDIWLDKVERSSFQQRLVHLRPAFLDPSRKLK
jgi:hypothetical protein